MCATLLQIEGLILWKKVKKNKQMEQKLHQQSNCCMVSGKRVLCILNKYSNSFPSLLSIDFTDFIQENWIGCLVTVAVVVIPIFVLRHRAQGEKEREFERKGGRGIVKGKIMRDRLGGREMDVGRKKGQNGKGKREGRTRKSLLGHSNC